MQNEATVKKIFLKPAECAVDLGDGSERAEYVNQDYILNRLGRPHRCVNLMYTYYPYDEQWPSRISEACKDMNVSFAWDYPYDDYFPYGVDNQPFEQMKDIRRHGQDVMLTLTIDCKTDDEKIRDIARQLRPFGHVRLRINHECNGNWFTHNKRYSYEEVGAFFARAAKIIKAEAPNIDTVFCAGFLSGDATKLPYEDEFSEAYKAADVHSLDKYLALHWGWPYDVAEVGGNSFEASDVNRLFEDFRRTKEHLDKIAPGKKLILGELNTDGDVTGGFLQPDSVRRFYDNVRVQKATWLSGISMYQFRDRGRLGLEIEDPNNSEVGIEQPLLGAYKEIIRDDYFCPKIMQNTGENVTFPAAMKWTDSENAQGIAIEIELEDVPTFCEVTFDEKPALMMEFLGRWFYKAPGVTTIDLMSVFYEADKEGRLNTLFERGKKYSLNVFATPTDGINQNDDVEFITTIDELPSVRVRYNACKNVG